MIKKIVIKNFRSIKSQEIDLNWITTFVGENDAGKSNVFRALNLFFNDQTDPNELFNPQRDFHKDAKASQGKVKQIEIILHVELPSSYKSEGKRKDVVWRRVWRETGVYRQGETRTYSGREKIDGRSKIPTFLDRMKFTYIPAIKDKAFFSDLQGRSFDALQKVQEKNLKISAGTFENQIGQQIQGLLNSLNSEFNDVVTMQMPQDLRPIFETMELNAGGIPFSRRGDGIKIRHIPQIVKFISDQLDLTAQGSGVIGYNHIWGFEEPENNVEMSACFRMELWFRDLIRDNDHHQLLLTTHSPVFYKIEDEGLINDGDSWVIRYFLEKADDHTRFRKVTADHADMTLGLMPLVAPFVKEAKTRHDDLQSQLERVKSISANNIPTLFVEGKTDKNILEIAWRLFSTVQNDAIIIVDGDGDHGSANALASRALAWMLIMRHRDPSDRVKAFALFDNDNAGKNSKFKLQEDIRSVGIKVDKNYFQAHLLEAPEFARDIIKKKFKFQIDLESQFSADFWTLAMENKWLEPIEPSKILSADMINSSISNNINPFKNLSNIDYLRLSNKFSSNGKMLSVKYILGLNEDQQREILSGFEDLILKIKNALL